MKTVIFSGSKFGNIISTWPCLVFALPTHASSESTFNFLSDSLLLHSQLLLVRKILWFPDSLFLVPHKIFTLQNMTLSPLTTQHSCSIGRVWIIPSEPYIHTPHTVVTNLLMHVTTLIFYYISFIS